MLPKVLWNSLLVTPALLGAAMVVSSSAFAAEVQPLTNASALLNTDQASATAVDTDGISALTSDVSLNQADAPAQVSSAASSTSGNVAPVAALASQSKDNSAAPTSVSTLSQAATAPVRVAQQVAPVSTTPVAPASSTQANNSANSANDVTSLDEIMQYSGEGSDSQSQVTSITQLSDVQPTDWAYQALQSLVERYGCIAGYPDGTYKGQRAMTRFEFAAGMNACLDRISELIASSTADLATKEDLATLQRLQEEFAAELAVIRGRVDALEARVGELEANQFSTTTKLNGETIFAAAADFTPNNFNEPGRDTRRGDIEFGNDFNQAIAGYRVRLNFDTSFTGEDLLRARLQAREFDDFGGFGANTSWQWGSGQPDGSTSSTVSLDDLLYTFPLGNRVQVILGANSIGNSDFVASTVSPFDSSGQGSLTNGLGTPPQYNFIPGGTGAGAIVQITDNFSLDFGYAAGDAGNPQDGSGIFNGDYGGIAQLTYLSDFVDAAVMYSNGYSQSGFGYFGGYNLGNYFGSNLNTAGDAVSPEVINIYAGQVNFKLARWFQIGGGVMYAPVRVLGNGDYRIWSYHGTFAFPDLGGEGNLLGFVVGVPPRVSGVDTDLQDSVFLGGGGGNQPQQDASLLVEGFYRLRINDNISITPGVVWLTSPGNQNRNGSSVIGAIRTTFTF
jgi:hypothetical protein